MKVIGVTGGLGFLGSNLIPVLQSKLNCDIKVIDNKTNACDYVQASKDIQIIEGDIRDETIVNDFVKGCDTIVHLAAHTRVIDSIDNPRLNIDINVNGSLNLLEACRYHDVVNFVNASTGGAILGEVPPPIHEDIVGRPASPYGASKASVESLCWAYEQSFGMNTTSLRFSNVYGPKCKKKESVVAKFYRDIIQNQEIIVYGDGEQTRDFLYVEDLANGVIKSIQKKKSGVFQLASGNPLSVNGLIALMKPVIGSEFNVRYLPARAGEVKHTFCSIQKAKAELNWIPSQNIMNGLKVTFDYCKTVY